MPVLPTILLIIDTISSIPLFPFEHKFCHNENCWGQGVVILCPLCDLCGYLPIPAFPIIPPAASNTVLTAILSIQLKNPHLSLLHLRQPHSTFSGRSTVCPCPYGPHFVGDWDKSGGNRAITGLPSPAAKCIGPVLGPIKR